MPFWTISDPLLTRFCRLTEFSRSPHAIIAQFLLPLTRRFTQVLALRLQNTSCDTRHVLTPSNRWSAFRTQFSIPRPTEVHMPYDNKTLFAALDMPLAQTSQFTILQSPSSLITVHMLCAQNTSSGRSPRFASAFHENRFYLLLISYVLHSKSISFVAEYTILRTFWLRVLFLAGKYAYVNV